MQDTIARNSRRTWWIVISGLITSTEPTTHCATIHVQLYRRAVISMGDNGQRFVVIASFSRCTKRTPKLHYETFAFIDYFYAKCCTATMVTRCIRSKLRVILSTTLGSCIDVATERNRTHHGNWFGSIVVANGFRLFAFNSEHPLRADANVAWSTH